MLNGFLARLLVHWMLLTSFVFFEPKMGILTAFKLWELVHLYACQPYTVREQIINISATRFLNALDEISNVGLHSRHLCNFFPQGLLQRRLSKNKILTTVTFSWIPNVGYASCYGYFEETQILTTTKKYTRFPLTLMSRLPAHFLENTAPELQITSWSF